MSSWMEGQKVRTGEQEDRQLEWTAAARGTDELKSRSTEASHLQSLMHR